MAMDPARDKALQMVPSEHLFEANTTRIAVRRGNYPRGFTCRFIQLCVPTLKEAKRAAIGADPGDDAVYPVLFRSIFTAERSTSLKHLQRLAAHSSTIARGGSISILLHRGAADGAEIALLPLQARGDGTDIGDFARTEAIDIGRAGLSLLSRSLIGLRSANGTEHEHQFEHCCETVTGRNCDALCAHDSIPVDGLGDRAKMPLDCCGISYFFPSRCDPSHAFRARLPMTMREPGC
jgi:hypothetical protein